ncbi:MAG: helix-turn-helix transcriptional regulator [Anaerolineae bacterium]
MEQTFGQALRELRRSKGISQRDLAEKVRVDFSYISKIENDRLPSPAADTIVKICDALEVSPDTLLALSGKIPSELRDTIGSSPAAMQFIRNAQSMDLTEEEWKELTKQLKRLRS